MNTSKCCRCGYTWTTGQDGSHSCAGVFEERIRKTVALAFQYGQIDGAHHKMWVIDQMVRLLAEEDYDVIINAACDGEDGPNTYSWDCGIAP